MKVTFDEQAWDDYKWWQAQDRKMLRRINMLIDDIARNPDGEGLGKPELLSGSLSGYASRRINQEHRIIYKVVGEEIRIATCRFHY